MSNRLAVLANAVIPKRREGAKFDDPKRSRLSGKNPDEQIRRSRISVGNCDDVLWQRVRYSLDLLTDARHP